MVQQRLDDVAARFGQCRARRRVGDGWAVAPPPFPPRSARIPKGVGDLAEQGVVVQPGLGPSLIAIQLSFSF